MSKHEGIRHSDFVIRHFTRRVRRAFTLVELLIVIAIIGILAGLILVVVTSGIGRARITSIKAEIESLSNAVEEYKNEYGAYPPNAFARDRIDDPSVPQAQADRFVRHIRKAFPRYVPVGGVVGINTDIANGTASPFRPTKLDIGQLDPAEELVFWLGGLPLWRTETAVELTGFSLDARRPFLHPDMLVYEMVFGADTGTPDVVQEQRSDSLFEFDPTRLVDRDDDGWPEYIPRGRSPFDMPPYVYFHSSVYGFSFYPVDPLDPLNFPQSFDDWGGCMAYAGEIDDKGAPNDESQWQAVSWANAGRFQIISAGLDGVYGTKDETAVQDNYPRGFPLGKGYDNDEDDNLTNFAQDTLGAERERAQQ